MRHKRVGKRMFVLTLLAAVTQPAAAAELSKVAWHTDVSEAWKVTQQQRRPLLVFVTHDQCVFCTKMKNGTLADLNVASAINRAYVPLTHNGSAGSQLIKDLHVTSYPATFIISPQAVVIDRIEGYVTPQVLARRLSPASRGRPAGS